MTGLSSSLRAASKPAKGHIDVYHAEQFYTKLRLDGSVCMILGRDPSVCDVAIEDECVSRQHAVLVHSDKGLRIIDISRGRHTRLSLSPCGRSFSHCWLDVLSLRVLH